MYQFPRGSSRRRAAQLPYGAFGRTACKRSTHPTKGSAGLEIRGLRPSKQAHKYQSASAAGLSQNPIVRKADKSAPNVSRKARNTGWSQTASTLGNRRMSGLAAATAKAPR